MMTIISQTILQRQNVDDGGGGGGPEILSYTPSIGDLMFDIPRSYGYNGVPVVGAIVISDDISDLVMIKVMHNDGVVPTISVPVGVTLSKIAGEYIPTVDNEMYFIAHKGAGNVVDMITYTISPKLN